MSPKLALQALGVARVTEEIVGLTVARRLAEMHFPAKIVEGLSAWLSLDEYTEWFGGHAQVRADMCRISIGRDEAGQLFADVLVLEGKLRQLYDGHGVLQVRRTCDFFRSILANSSQGIPKIDATMWKELLASAIEHLAAEAVLAFCCRSPASDWMSTSSALICFLSFDPGPSGCAPLQGSIPRAFGRATTAR